MKIAASLAIAAAAVAVAFPASAQFAKPKTQSNTARAPCS